jgi:tetratricopeptide (TPR) repeat protein
VRLYTESYRLGTRLEGGRTWEGALALVTEALKIDPEFPTARIWRAWCLYRHRRFEEAVREAERAVALTPQAGPWEQHWIRGSYHHLIGDFAAAAREYEALRRLQPDHYWAISNLRGVYSRLGKDQEAKDIALAWAALRPNQPSVVAIAINELIRHGDREHAGPYVAHLARLLDGREPSERAAQWPTVALHDAFLALERGDAPAARAVVDAAAREFSTSQGALRQQMARSLSIAYLILGRLDDARGFARQLAIPELSRVHLARIEVVAGDVAAARALMRGFSADAFFDAVGGNQFATTMHLAIWTMIGAGLVDEADRVLASWEAAPEGRARPVQYQRLSLRGRIALGRGNLVAAARDLADAIDLMPTDPNAVIRFAEPLAAIHRRRQDADSERVLLERAVAGVMRMPEPALFATTPMQLRLAAIYRDLGDVAKAQAIEQQLVRLLAAADQDLPVLVALRKHLAAVGAASN